LFLLVFGSLGKTPEGVELWNKGIALAQDAAKAVDGKVVAPVFNDEDKARGLSDFNDLYQVRGLDAVKKQLEPALAKDNTQDKGKAQELSL